LSDLNDADARFSGGDGASSCGVVGAL